jgi:hypothetical protein
MNVCDQLRNRVEEFLEERLAAEERKSFEAHLESCRSCVEWLEARLREPLAELIAGELCRLLEEGTGRPPGLI